jgi:hypothetical protein
MPAVRSARICSRSTCGSQRRVFSGVETSASQIPAQIKPTAPVMMKDQRHESVWINHATAGAPRASPRLDPPEVTAIAVPRSL